MQSSRSTESRVAVLVTGASSGVGRACAYRLAKRDCLVYAGVRSDADASSIEAQDSDRIRAVRLDVTEPHQIASVTARLHAELGEAGLTGLVGSAGICLGGPLELMKLEDFRRQLEVNVTGQLAVIQATLPLLRLARGRIVSIGSTSGHIASRLTGSYCASKAALDAIMKTLQLELRPFGVHACSVDPGVVTTPFWQKALRFEALPETRQPEELRDLYRPALERRRRNIEALDVAGMQPEVVALVVERALFDRQPRLRYVVGRSARIRLTAARLLPEPLWYRLASRRSE